MIGKINCYIKVVLYCMIVMLSVNVYAFESVKNVSARNKYFTGRTSYLNNIQKNLLQYGNVYLTGYGGIGKTQTAKEFSYIHEKKYDLIWWFNAKEDLKIQYESLLTHLSNNKNFKKLLHININNISPNVVIDFTNSLLSESPDRWLLIFDNVMNDRNIKLPKTKKSCHHIIITTRKQYTHGNNTLNLEPFTNNEANLFLTKLHPKEKKEEISRLSKMLGNYPLALAQISNEILLYKEGISQFLKKRFISNIKTPTMHSAVTQKYNNNYHKVLNLTLQEIEQKDKEAAKFLYMLALLQTNLKKEFIIDLFGNRIEEKIIILSKYGIVQTGDYEHSKILTIHDIIREEALKRFNSKPKDYQIKILQNLEKHFKKFYTGKTLQQLYELDATNNHVAVTYIFLSLALQNDTIDEGTANVAVIAIKLNNMLYNRRSNYVLHKDLVNKISNKNLENLSPRRKALLYACIIVSSLVVESDEKISKVRKEILKLVNVLEKKKDYKTLFYVYTRISLYHIMTGDFSESKKCLKVAQKYIDYVDNQFDLLLFWYTNAWMLCEFRDVESGTHALDNFLNLSNKLLSPLGKLFGRDIKVKLLIAKGQNKLAEKELNKIMKEAIAYTNNIPSVVLAQLEYTKTMLYFQTRNDDQIKKQCHHALKILNKVLGRELDEQPQAHIHVMLGKVYENINNHSKSLEKYMKALKYYSNKSRGRVNNFYGYAQLLANLSLLYYKQHNYERSRHYYKTLIKNFELDHDIVEKLVKTLPSEYVYKMNTVYNKK